MIKHRSDSRVISAFMSCERSYDYSLSVYVTSADNTSFLFPRSARACHKNGIFSDKLDVAPRYDRIVVSSEKSEKLQSAVYNNRYKLGSLCIDLYVVYKSKSHSVGLVDDLFMTKLRYSAAHKITPLTANI